MRKLRVLLLTLAALAGPVAVATPANAAEVCKQAQVCFYTERNFEGYKSFYWDDALPLSKKLDARDWGYARSTSSVKNLTPYYFHIWNAQGSHRCLPPGYVFGNVGPAYEDRISHIGLYTNWC